MRAGNPILAAMVGLVIGLTVAGCPDKKPKYPLCSKDEECKDGEHCVNKRCQQCGVDEHCPDGERCVDGACFKDVPECTSDEECPDGKVCKDEKCVPCQKNADCGPGGTCNADGSCDRPKACKVDEDCEDDEDCIDGRCQRPWMGTAPDDVSCQFQTVYFEFDQAVVPTSSRDAVSENAECLQSAADRGAYVMGYADESGTEEYNIALSERRAQAVADYLARLGIDPARLQILPKGESELSGQGPEKDRRVELQWK